MPPAARFTLPANFFSFPGQAIRVRGAGRVSTVTTPGTLTLDVRFGPTGNIVVFNGGAMTLNATAQTNATWEFEATLVCRSIGSGTAATMLGHRLVRSSRAWSARPPLASGYAGNALLPDTAPAVGTGFDSTVANIVDFFATWGTSTPTRSSATSTCSRA